MRRAWTSSPTSVALSRTRPCAEKKADGPQRDGEILPICSGGCPNKRLRALQFGEAGLEYCLPFKERLVEYLEAYYDAFLTQEIWAAVRRSGRRVRDERGWRLVSPVPKGSEGNAERCRPLA